MLVNNNALTALKTPVRRVEGRVYAYNANGSTAYTFRHDDKLKEFTVERIGDNSKFFGYGICHKANIKVLDTDREITLNTSQKIYPYFVNRGTATESIFPYPFMDVTEVHRDENTNELSITCYDPLYKATKHTVSELELETPYTIGYFVMACVQFLGLSDVVVINMDEEDSVFYLEYEEGANFEGTETIREAFDAVAEATQTIYYVDRLNRLVLKRLDISGDALLTIEKPDYITLETKTNRRLSTIVHVTELDEDGIPKTTGESGSTQYVRDNPFWEKREREDIEALVQNAINAAGGLTINQFECNWRGNYLLEVGDKIDLVTKDGNTVTSYVLDDTVSYNGALSEKTRWSYTESSGESESKPTTLGEAVKQTYARVDRVNHEVELVASKADANESAIAAIKATTEGITASVENIQSAADSTNQSLETLTKKVEATVTAEDVKLQISTEMEKGVDKVTTKTGFTFDENGLTVDKDDSEMKTTISDDGMKVYKNDEEVLTANNEGVKATNLHADTYLIIGTNSRIEDFGSDRTAIFWIGL